MSRGSFSILIFVGAALVVLGLSAFTVNEREIAIKLQLGRVVTTNYEPGLHWKWPLVQNVRKFPRRILTISDRPERVFTAENEAVQVDFFVKWRIVDVAKFYEAFRGDAQKAAQRLLSIVKDGLMDVKRGKQRLNLISGHLQKSGGLSKTQY